MKKNIILLSLITLTTAILIRAPICAMEEHERHDDYSVGEYLDWYKLGGMVRESDVRKFLSRSGDDNKEALKKAAAYDVILNRNIEKRFLSKIDDDISKLSPSRSMSEEDVRDIISFWKELVEYIKNKIATTEIPQYLSKKACKKAMATSLKKLKKAKKKLERALEKIREEEPEPREVERPEVVVPYIGLLDRAIGEGVLPGADE